MPCSRADKRTWVLPVLGLWLAGCPTPTQYGGPIPINPAGMDERIAWVCGLGQSNPDVSAFCFPDDARSAQPSLAPASAASAVSNAPMASSAAVPRAPASGVAPPADPVVQTPTGAAGPGDDGAPVDSMVPGPRSQDSGARYLIIGECPRSGR